MLDVHAGDVVGQQHDLVAVQFLLVFLRKAAGFDLAHDAGDEVAGADEGVEDVNVFVAEAAAELRFQNLLDAADHEIDDGLGRVDDAVGVGLLAVEALKEALVDRVEEFLLFGVVLDRGGCLLDGLVEGVECRGGIRRG